MLCLVVENSGHRADCARSRRPLLLIMHEWEYVPHNGGRFGQNIEKGKCRHALFWPSMLSSGVRYARVEMCGPSTQRPRSLFVFLFVRHFLYNPVQIVELDSFRTGIHKSHSRPARPDGQRDARRNMFVCLPSRKRGFSLHTNHVVYLQLSSL